ncbi:MAG: integrase [Clostridia bacterium]|nr:integrase [Clostridia bacterium]
MGHTPLGYRIVNGAAVVDKAAALKLRTLYGNYLAGMSLEKAAKEAGFEMYHASVKRLLMTRRYLGDDFYPVIIDRETFDKVQAEREKRAYDLKHMTVRSIRKMPGIPTRFSIGAIDRRFDDPAMQAEYAYSQIKCEVG